MKEKVVEILVYLMNEIQENKTIGEIELADLKDRGYTASEIGTAFSWLHEHFQGSDWQLRRIARPKQGSHRVLHEAEKYVMTTEAQGYLINLRELGLLDDNDVEVVIERTMMTGYEKVSVPELQGIVASVLFSKSGRTGGHRFTLNSGESIH